MTIKQSLASIQRYQVVCVGEEHTNGGLGGKWGWRIGNNFLISLVVISGEYHASTYRKCRVL